MVFHRNQSSWCRTISRTTTSRQRNVFNSSIRHESRWRQTNDELFFFIIEIFLGQESLSVLDLSTDRHFHVKHYRIHRTDQSFYYISYKNTFKTLAELVEHYQSKTSKKKREPRRILLAQIKPMVSAVPWRIRVKRFDQRFRPIGTVCWNWIEISWLEPNCWAKEITAKCIEASTVNETWRSNAWKPTEKIVWPTSINFSTKRKLWKIFCIKTSFACTVSARTRSRSSSSRNSWLTVACWTIFAMGTDEISFSKRS